MDTAGLVDLPDDILKDLDYAIISLHSKNFSPMDASSNTDALINAMEHPRVFFIGHPDDSTFPLDYDRLLNCAKKRGVYPEINNASLMPDAYRKNALENSIRVLTICKAIGLPVLLSSDSHGREHVGDFSHIYPLLHKTDFPASLIMNADPEMPGKIF